MKRFLWFALLFLAAAALLGTQPAYANTYVGNGGNAGDVEWSVSLKQIQAAVNLISQDPPADDLLCTCSDTFSNHAICESLKILTKEQTRFCGVTLKAQLPTLQALLSSQRNVRVDWTYDDIEVIEDGQHRAVDAVTDRSQGKITLNLPKFTAMNASERVFLISHELMHLTTLNGLPLTDEGAQGPFDTKQGSRQLINSMASALVIEADEANAFDKYRSILKRPQGWKKNWFELSFGKSDVNTRSVYSPKSLNKVRGRFTHYFNDFGVNVGFAETKGDKLTLTSIRSNETIRSLQAGVSYRLFPFKDPLTFAGQSHLVLSVDFEAVRGEMKLNDTFNNEAATSNRLGASAEIRYYFPVAANLWLSIAGAYESLAGKYTLYPNTASQVVIENQENELAAYAGVSFGF